MYVVLATRVIHMHVHCHLAQKEERFQWMVLFVGISSEKVARAGLDGPRALERDPAELFLRLQNSIHPLSKIHCVK